MNFSTLHKLAAAAMLAAVLLSAQTGATSAPQLAIRTFTPVQATSATSTVKTVSDDEGRRTLYAILLQTSPEKAAAYARTLQKKGVPIPVPNGTEPKVLTPESWQNFITEKKAHAAALGVSLSANGTSVVPLLAPSLAPSTALAAPPPVPSYIDVINISGVVCNKKPFYAVLNQSCTQEPTLLNGSIPGFRDFDNFIGAESILGQGLPILNQSSYRGIFNFDILTPYGKVIEAPASFGLYVQDTCVGGQNYDVNASIEFDAYATTVIAGPDTHALAYVVLTFAADSTGWEIFDGWEQVTAYGTLAYSSGPVVCNSYPVN